MESGGTLTTTIIELQRGSSGMSGKTRCYALWVGCSLCCHQPC